MVPRSQTFFSAALIARAARTSKPTTHRRAARQSWPGRRDANRFLYSPPLALLAKCRRLAARSHRRGLDDALLDEASRYRLLRISNRVSSVLELDRLVRLGKPREQSIRAVVGAFSFQISARQLRSWWTAFSRHGLVGLMERKLNRVGGVGARKGRAQ